MATTGVDSYLIDTNILIYSKVALSPFHHEAVAALHNLEAAGHVLWTSRQIMREYLAAMSKPGTLTAPVSMTALTSDVRDFEARFQIAEDGPHVTAHLLQLLGTVPCAGKQVHDANLVATMLGQGLGKLLTHNIADFTRFSGYITVVPLVP